MKRLLKSLAKYICAVNLYFVLYKMIVEKDIYLNNSYAPACLYSLIKYTNENRKKRWNRVADRTFNEKYNDKNISTLIPLLTFVL